MLETIRELSREVKLQNLIINNFVPAEYQVNELQELTGVLQPLRFLSAWSLLPTTDSAMHSLSCDNSFPHCGSGMRV